MPNRAVLRYFSWLPRLMNCSTCKPVAPDSAAPADQTVAFQPHGPQHRGVLSGCGELCTALAGNAVQRCQAQQLDSTSSHDQDWLPYSLSTQLTLSASEAMSAGAGEATPA